MKVDSTYIPFRQADRAHLLIQRVNYLFALILDGRIMFVDLLPATQQESPLTLQNAKLITLPTEVATEEEERDEQGAHSEPYSYP